MAPKTKNRPKVVLTYPLNPKVVSRELRGMHVVIAQTRSKLIREIQEADALVSLVTNPVDSKLLAHARHLKVVGNCAVGIDNISLSALRAKKIRLVNTPDVLNYATAELALTLLLAAARRVPEGEALCRKGRFRGWAPDLLLGQEIKHRRALIVGYGRIGKETAKLFRALGLHVDWINQQDTPASIRKKLKRAQVVSLHLPYTPKTHHWLDAKRLTLLPREAIVINTSRGPVIDEKALISALKNRNIFAAGLDVFEQEPKIPRALRHAPNVVLLPHLGSATTQARDAMIALVCRGVRSILGGQHPWNEVKSKPNQS